MQIIRGASVTTQVAIQNGYAHIMSGVMVPQFIKKSFCFLAALFGCMKTKSNCWSAYMIQDTDSVLNLQAIA